MVLKRGEVKKGGLALKGGPTDPTAQYVLSVDVCEVDLKFLRNLSNSCFYSPLASGSFVATRWSSIADVLLRITVPKNPCQSSAMPVQVVFLVSEGHNRAAWLPLHSHTFSSTCLSSWGNHTLAHSSLLVFFSFLVMLVLHTDALGLLSLVWAWYRVSRVIQLLIWSHLHLWVCGMFFCMVLALPLNQCNPLLLSSWASVPEYHVLLLFCIISNVAVSDTLLIIMRLILSSSFSSNTMFHCSHLNICWLVEDAWIRSLPVVLSWNILDGLPKTLYLCFFFLSP